MNSAQGGRYHVTFGIGMTESFDAIDDVDCDRIIAEMVNGRDSLRTRSPQDEVIIVDPVGTERKAILGDYLQG